MVLRMLQACDSYDMTHNKISLYQVTKNITHLRDIHIKETWCESSITSCSRDNFVSEELKHIINLF